MNLIERLEGYDKAKLIVDNQINSEFQTEFFDINGNYYANDFGDLVIYRNDQWVNFDSTDPKFELFSITDLEAEVMQYRREHKIFQVGDQVALTNLSWSSSSLHRVLEVRGRATIFVCPINQATGSDMEVLGFCVAPYFLRHISEAEFVANKRMGVS